VVIESVWRALKPGGRVIAEFGGRGNIDAILNAVNKALDLVEIDGIPIRRPDFYFPTFGEYTPLLERFGFEVTLAAHFDRPTPLNGDVEGMRSWLQMFGKDYLDPLSSRQRDELIFHVEEATQPVLYREGR
jgi:hypothetical protein